MGRSTQAALVRAAGAVAAAAGTHQLCTGVAGVRPEHAGAAREPARPSLDSELRFYAAWYVAGGLLMLRRPEPDRATAQALSCGWLLGAAGRLLSLRAVGRPHPLFLALGAAELGLGGLLLRRAVTGPGRGDLPAERLTADAPARLL